VQDVHNVADLVRRAAAGDGANRTALCWHDRRLTWAELDAQVDAVAAALGGLAVAAAGDAAAVTTNAVTTNATTTSAVTTSAATAGEPAAGDAVATDPATGGQPASGAQPAPAESSVPAGSSARPHGPRLAVALPNVMEFATTYFGALRAGFVVVPVNPGFTARELRHVIADSGASVLVGTPAVLDALGAEAPAVLRYRYSLGDGYGRGEGAEATGGGDGRRPYRELLAAPSAAGSPVPARGGGEDLAVLVYTSGTSGTPKGAMLSHRALLANHEQLAAIEPAPIGPDDVVLLTLPLFHSYGLNAGLGAVAYHGACGVLVERFDPADTLVQIARHKVTAVIGVPPMFVAWSLMGGGLARGFATVRTIVSGASPLDTDTARRFSEIAGAPIHEGYGLTETAPVLTTTLGNPTPKIGSIGRPLPYAEVRLQDSAGGAVAVPSIAPASGQPVPDDEPDDEDDDEYYDYDSPGSPGTDPGEIVARGPNLFSGYWPDGRDGPDADGWWATGDVAYADEDGDLFLVDRLGELILVSGFNVYPHEVELVLAAHPSVVEAAAVGVPHPYTGQAVKAYVVREPGTQVTAEELITHCERNLARFKCPTAIEFIAELPKTATGKVRKGALGALP
jgi:long-chain acyl-CoA synthetase